MRYQLSFTGKKQAMSEGEVLAINNQIDKLINTYEDNQSVNEIIYDVLVSKELNKFDLRNKAIYEDYIRRMKSHRSNIRLIYMDLAEIYNINEKSIQRIILSASKKCN